jgi:hypothetical protein
VRFRPAVVAKTAKTSATIMVGYHFRLKNEFQAYLTLSVSNFPLGLLFIERNSVQFKVTEKANNLLEKKKKNDWEFRS